MNDSDIILAIIGLRGDLSPGGQITLDKLVNALQDRTREKCAQIAENHRPRTPDNPVDGVEIARKIRESRTA